MSLVDLQHWWQSRRLHKAIFRGAELRQCGIVLGALMAAICVWEEMERHRSIPAIIIGSLVAWGAYGGYESVSALNYRCDECERQLRQTCNR